MRRLCGMLGALAIGLATPAAGAEAALLHIDGPIGPATASYFDKAVAQAQTDGAALIVLQIDTPGGLSSAMRDIVKTILASPLPIVGYVAPGGARAASAGTYILMATHVAAMAPATNLGAATPIPAGGDWPAPGGKAGDGKADTARPPVGAEETKAVNDAVAYIRSLAEQRGRNADWAESAVRNGASLSATQALQQHVIDLISASPQALLQQLEGRSVALPGGAVTLHTAGLTLHTLEPDWRMRLLAVITSPTIAYLLVTVGIFGLLLEGYNPGATLPGVVGGISLLLGLYAMQQLPINYAGLGLMLLGIALMIAETMAPTFGALGFGGIVSFVLGSVFLMDTDVPGFGINVGLIAGIALGAAAVLMLTVYLLWRARRAPPVTGSDAMLGQMATTLQAIDGEGWAQLNGEHWRVRCSVPLAAGVRVRVLRVEGLMLIVEPAVPN